MPEVSAPASRLWVHVGLFLLAVVTVSFAGRGFFSGPGTDAVAFAAVLLPILLCHEMGHFFLGRLHQMTLTLPYFIPVPFGFGTLGAVIVIRSRFPNRNALVDVGAAGPLAGAVAAIAANIYGVQRAELVEIPAAAAAHGSSLLAVLQSLFSAMAAPSGTAATQARVAFVVGDSLLTRMVTHFFRGEIPAGHDLLFNPALLASSAVLIITMANLFPVGQLDGGHVAYAVFGKYHPDIGRIALLVMVGLGVFFWVGWLFWALLAALLVRVDHPPVVDEQEPLSPGRVVVAVLCLVLFAITFTATPFDLVVES
jgi:membrane-associated protease RseP (regulator of RpoE activity)